MELRAAAALWVLCGFLLQPGRAERPPGSHLDETAIAGTAGPGRAGAAGGVRGRLRLSERGAGRAACGAFPGPRDGVRGLRGCGGGSEVWAVRGPWGGSEPGPVPSVRPAGVPRAGLSGGAALEALRERYRQRRAGGGAPRGAVGPGGAEGSERDPTGAPRRESRPSGGRCVGTEGSGGSGGGQRGAERLRAPPGGRRNGESRSRTERRAEPPRIAVGGGGGGR